MVVSPRCLERGAIPRLRHTINVRDDRPPSKQAARSAPSNSAVARLAWRADRGPIPHVLTDASMRSNESGQRTTRAVNGEGKCAVHISVDVSQKRPNNSRLDSPACFELESLITPPS